MRLLIVTAAVAALSLPAFAQQGRPQQPQQQQKPPAQQQQQQQQAAPAPAQEAAQAPGMFACRTEAEVCYIAIVTGKNEVSVLYTNDPKSDGIEEKPIGVQPVDLGQHMGRVVMLGGQYNPQTGLSNVEIIDVAPPLLSFAIKSMLSGGNEEEEQPEPPPPPSKKPAPKQQQQQQRR